MCVILNIEEGVKCWQAINIAEQLWLNYYPYTLNRCVSSSPSYSLDPMQTRLRMPFPNVNMPCSLQFCLVIIVLFHCRASSPAQYFLSSPFVPPPTHAVTSPGLNGVSRDNLSHRHSMPRFTSTVFTSYHTLVCT